MRDVEALSEPALALFRRELEAVYGTLAARAEVLAESMAARVALGESVSDAHIYGLLRARELARQVESEIARVALAMGQPLSQAQVAALQQGVNAAEATVGALLPAGMDISALGPWTRPPLGALQAALGAQQGAPLGSLLQAIGRDAGERVARTLNAGLVAGKNPRAIAREMARLGDLSRARAEVIARTSTLQAYRVSSLETYRVNNIREFERLASHSGRSCAACLALDGHRQSTDQLMAVHVQDRCTVVPVISIPGTQQPRRQTGTDWFANQDADTQRRILGKGGYDLYSQGTPLSAFAKRTDDKDWGPQLTVRPLKEIRPAA
jgi:SPP1 gp7 family putative phage head morphogenesis protein